MNGIDLSFFNEVSKIHLFWGIAVFIFAVLLAGSLRFVLKKKSAKASMDSTSTEIHPRLVTMIFSNASATPLALLICCWGASIGFWIMAQDFEDPAKEHWMFSTIHWLNYLAIFVSLIWFALLFLKIAEFWLRRWLGLHGNKWDKILALLLLQAARFLVPYAGIIILIQSLNLPQKYHLLFSELTSLGLIAGAGYILFHLVNGAETIVLDEFKVNVRDNLAVRKIYTQVKMLKRISVILIILFTISCMLMVFEPVRHLGTSILASAGVAGIVIGFAAQRTLGSFLAGMQIAFTQPIRLDDVVIVEGEWGRIEEITLTYVVILIWDLRRLVVPITYFLEKPFQNWTRVNAALLGTVFLYVDYTTPVQEMREELDRILSASTLWDKKTKGLQVTDSKERTLELRILVSAADSSSAFDLRCDVREKLVRFLQKNHPQCLPRIRVDSDVPAPDKAIGAAG